MSRTMIELLVYCVGFGLLALAFIADRRQF